MQILDNNLLTFGGHTYLSYLMTNYSIQCQELSSREHKLLFLFTNCHGLVFNATSSKVFVRIYALVANNSFISFVHRELQTKPNIDFLVNPLMLISVQVVVAYPGHFKGLAPLICITNALLRYHSTRI